MPKLVNTETGPRYVKTKIEVAGILEKYRESTGKNKKDFSEFLGITGEVYNHILKGSSYPSFRSLSILNQNGFPVGSILGLDDGDVAKIRAGEYDE